ncbi:MAG: hypothetical protein M1297_06410 [Nitrospirae bacterium]|nr:hypothetical protein [Nitrospirota bacterium]
MELRLRERRDRLIAMKIVKSSRSDDGPDLPQNQKLPLPVGGHLPGRMHEQAAIQQDDYRHAPEESGDARPAPRRCLSDMFLPESPAVS